jgi:Flp pilus assembly protein CpaB
MNRTRLLVIGIVALVLGWVLSSFVYQSLQAKMALQKVGVDVVVAANDIQVGAKIGDGDLKVVKYPPEDLPRGVFHTKASAVGRGTVLPIGKGEFIVPDKLSVQNAGAGLSTLIALGMRA